MVWGHDRTHCSSEEGRVGEQGHAGVRVCGQARLRIHDVEVSALAPALMLTALVKQVYSLGHLQLQGLGFTPHFGI